MSAARFFSTHSKWGWRRSALLLALIILVVYGGFVLYPRLARASTIELPAGLTRAQIAERIGTQMQWTETEQKEFAATYAKMQWMAFTSYIPQIFEKSYDWDEKEKEIFLTSSARYVEPEYDFLSAVYAPGSYTFRGSDSFARISSALIEPVTATSSAREFVESHLDKKAADNVARLVLSHFENMPDLVPLPPFDLTMAKSESGDQLLRFTTTFFNQGKGPLELRADPNTAGIRSDVERTVFQRVYREDGSWRDRAAGKFLWHQEHLHYHFADFAVYDLEAIETASPPPDLSGVRQKSTFCIRDVSRTNLDLPNEPTDASYKICGKELQGISVGWGDTYFYTYPDQLLNIQDLPSGTYRLKFVINPLDRFDESDMANNTSTAVIRLDMEKETVELVGEEPEKYPEIEHVYPEQDCPNCYG